jgi:hypothetical protein
MKLLLMKAINLLYGYNQMVKTDPQYKLDKPYSPKTDIDSFLEMDEVSPIVKQMLLDGDIVRKSKHTDFGDYEKVEYLVELLNGEVVVCYPNAGLMNATDSSGRVFGASDVWSFKVDPDSEG